MSKATNVLLNVRSRIDVVLIANLQVVAAVLPL